MSLYALDAVFRPRSVALVGASPRERSVGRAILRNLREAGFAGPMGVVNPRHASLEGVASVARLAALPFQPDLVIVSSPVETVPDVIADAVAAGARAAIEAAGGKVEE